MAVIRRTLEDIRGLKHKIDGAKVKATTEKDVRRHMIEDGEDPAAEYRLETSFTPRAIRARLGMTQEQFARAIGIPVATLRNWEQGRHAIDPAARSLLILVARDPNGTLAVLAEGRRTDAA
ncbi:MAG: helix-turn-helix domain-containing protein [Rhizobiales bacterium]|nr:helix-turn-helix domain-containing protein [Hyphomicrobiales bacterium]MBI3674760.1 helix-turn-helix domain-containing protein [Hyphomicrobiales bacterium]